MTNEGTRKNECGTCNFCCKLQGIKELAKPVNRWCQHAKPGCGCSIYATRPESCAGYACIWLSVGLPEEFRPDRCKIILEAMQGCDDRIIFRVEPKDYATIWQSQAGMALIGTFMGMGFMIVMTDGTHRARLFSKDGIDPRRWKLQEGAFHGKEGDEMMFRFGQDVIARGRIADA